jgi:hypothetical protein
MTNRTEPLGIVRGCLLAADLMQWQPREGGR